MPAPMPAPMLATLLALPLLAAPAHPEPLPPAWTIDWQPPGEATPGPDLSFAYLLDVGDGRIAITDGPRTRIYRTSDGALLHTLVLDGRNPAAHDRWSGRYLIVEEERDLEHGPEATEDGPAALGDATEEFLQVWDLHEGRLAAEIPGPLVEWEVLGDRLVLSTETHVERWSLGERIERMWRQEAVRTFEEETEAITVAVDCPVQDLVLTTPAIYAGFDPRFTPFVPILRFGWDGEDARPVQPPSPAWEPFIWRSAGDRMLVVANYNQGKPPFRFMGWDLVDLELIYDHVVEELVGYHPWSTEDQMGRTAWFEEGVYLPFIEDHGQAVPETRRAKILDLRTGRVTHRFEVYRTGVHVARDGTAWWLTPEPKGGFAVLGLSTDGEIAPVARFEGETPPGSTPRFDGRVWADARDAGDHTEIFRIDPRAGHIEILLERPEEDGEVPIRLWTKCVLEDGTVVAVEDRDGEPVRIYGLRPR